MIAKNTGSTHVYFNSVCLTIVAAIFIVLIIVIYLKKEKTKSATTNLFVITFLLNIICIILEFFMPFAVEQIMYYSTEISEFKLNFYKIICKSYMFVALLWDSVYIFYTIASTRNLKFFFNEEKKRFNKYAIFIFIGIFILSLSFVLMFDIEYLGGGNRAPYTIGGIAKFIFDGFTIIGSAYIIFVFTLYSNRVRNINVLPFYLIYIFYLILLLIEYFFNFFFNHLSFVQALIMLNTYFTIESQDNQLVYHYRKSIKEAKKANDAKTQFLINMSHEIRTPMNTILGFGETILNDEKVSEESFKSDFESISSASYTLLDLIDNIIDISRIESGKEVNNPVPYNTSNLVFEINSLVASKIKKDNLKFTIEADSNIPKVLEGDNQKEFKIISNVILNAIEYTNYGEVKLKIEGENKENNLYEIRFIVQNTGHAMTYEAFEKGMDDLGISDSNGTKGLNSLRIGLVIAKRLINIIDGTMEFINEKGQGTRYIMRFVQKIVDNNPIGDITMSENILNGTRRALIDCTGKNVLVVDDTEVNLSLASRYLKQYNFNVDTAKSGKECFELVQQKKYDVIFLDKLMPGLDGAGTIKLLNSLGIPLPPIIALTANTFDNSKDTFIEEGYNDFLNKPIVFRELNKIINKYFNSLNGGDIK